MRWSLDELVANISISKSYLEHAFKEEAARVFSDLPKKFG